jgi:cytochrome c-type biogenesis protein CcmF
MATLLAMALSVVGVVGSVLGARWDASFLHVARLSLYASAGLMTFGCLTLVYAFLQDDFSVLYVAMNSNSRLPVFYKVTALWGGHEGSLLFWAAMIGVYGAIVVRMHWKSDPDFMPSVIGVLSAVVLGFLAMILLLSNPFELIMPAPADGRDLNPLLQDFQMVFHPPSLFLGYTGFVAPFAFALAVLITGKGIDRWIFISRKWIILAWVFLTLGIALGGQWAYRELGWGGYWAWDPVENASFMPWLIGTAFLHSVMVQEQSKRFRIWNLSLAITAFAFSIFGTFLVRSGIISSVHAFASDPSRGLYLLAFFFAVLAVSFGLLVVKGDRFKSPDDDAPLFSRENLLLINNWIFLVATFTVVLGTLYPLFLDLTIEEKVTVAAPFFNQTFVPIMVFNIIFMAVAPMLPWRRFSGQNLKKVAVVPAASAVVGMGALFALGIQRPLPLISLGVAIFGSVLIGTDWVKGAMARAKTGKTHIGAGFLRLAGANRRRFGGLVAHVGILVLVVGFVGSYAYQKSIEIAVVPGERTAIGGYDILYTGTNPVSGPNWRGVAAHFDVFRDGVQVADLHPEKRTYMARTDMPTTEPKRLKRPTHELYITLGDVDAQTGRALAKIYINPLVHLVWFGAFLLILGGGISLTHKIKPRRKP